MNNNYQQRLAIIKREKNMMEKAMQLMKDKNIVCKMFSCGKTLTPTEYLFSDYCFKHQRLINQK